jgi:hypothetical protein
MNDALTRNNRKCEEEMYRETLFRTREIQFCDTFSWELCMSKLTFRHPHG